MEEALEMIEFEQIENPDTINDMLEAAKEGRWHSTECTNRTGYGFGLVIGENPGAKLLVKGDKHVTIPAARQRLGLPTFHYAAEDRYVSLADPPRFGDIVLFYQKPSVDWTAFYKLKCASVQGRDSDIEFLITEPTATRWLRIPKYADVTWADLSQVVGVVQRFKEPDGHDEQRTEQHGGRQSPG